MREEREKLTEIVFDVHATNTRLDAIQHSPMIMNDQFCNCMRWARAELKNENLLYEFHQVGVHKRKQHG